MNITNYTVKPVTVINECSILYEDLLNYCNQLDLTIIIIMGLISLFSMFISIFFYRLKSELIRHFIILNFGVISIIIAIQIFGMT